MHCPGPVFDKRWKPGKPAPVQWIARGGTGKQGNSGPCGRKLRPAAVRYRALADLARARRRYKTAANTRPTKPIEDKRAAKVEVARMTKRAA